MKRIIICSDGTWNRPEELGDENSFPTNVLKFARGIAPVDAEGTEQIVFYDWGIGSYHSSVRGGAFGAGLDKNIMDAYRFIVQNYQEGDKIFLFGFSRGAYTVRSLSGLINNCHILKSQEASRIEEAFKLYKTKAHKPDSDYSENWRNNYSLPNSGTIHFIGVWDTVGSMGLPTSIFGFIKKKNLFYDNKLGGNVKVARHALALDEKRRDFEPTIWRTKRVQDLKQVWFVGCHSDIGGSEKPDQEDDSLLSDIPMMWMKKEAEQNKLAFDDYFTVNQLNPHSKINESHKGVFGFIRAFIREIPSDNKIHISVKQRYETGNYKNKTIQKYLKDRNGDWGDLEH
jgi:uncharacterized protein (DUF2235 family)